METLLSIKQETCAKFQQEKLNSKVVGARQSFHFFGQNTWFLEDNRALSKFLYQILHLLNEFCQIIKKQSVKTNISKNSCQISYLHSKSIDWFLYGTRFC